MPRHVIRPSTRVPSVYRIKVEGELDEQWVDHFDGFRTAVERTPEEKCVTVMTGRVEDQSALHGILNRIRDLGLVLQSVDSQGGSAKIESGR